MNATNCETCGTGSRWWLKTERGHKCLTCGSNPLEPDGRADWKEFSRAKMVKQFGPRCDGDAELLARYREEIGT